jgi:hypothetical protein
VEWLLEKPSLRPPDRPPPKRPTRRSTRPPAGPQIGLHWFDAHRIEPIRRPDPTDPGSGPAHRAAETDRGSQLLLPAPLQAIDPRHRERPPRASGQHESETRAAARTARRLQREFAIGPARTTAPRAALARPSDPRDRLAHRSSSERAGRWRATPARALNEIPRAASGAREASGPIVPIGLHNVHTDSVCRCDLVRDGAFTRQTMSHRSDGTTDSECRVTPTSARHGRRVRSDVPPAGRVSQRRRPAQCSGSSASSHSVVRSGVRARRARRPVAGLERRFAAVDGSGCAGNDRWGRGRGRPRPSSDDLSD